MGHEKARRFWASLAGLMLVGACGVLAGCDSMLHDREDPGPGIRPTIGNFDTFPASDSILVVWDTGNYAPVDYTSQLPAPPVRGVGLFASTRSLEQGFTRVVLRDSSGRDSVVIPGAPDGRSIYLRLVTYDSAGQEIHSSRTLEAQSGEPEQVVVSLGNLGSYGGDYYTPMAWSRDGASLITVENEPGGTPNLVTRDVATGTSQPITRFESSEWATLYGPAIARDSDRIAFGSSITGVHRLYVMDSTAANPRTGTGGGAIDSDPAWGPGGRLYFMRGSSTGGKTNVPEIYRLDVDSGIVAPVLIDGRYKYGLAVDPSGTQIAYSTTADGKFNPDRRSIFAFSFNTGAVTRLLPNSPSSNRSPSWSGDGRELFFVSDRSGHFEVWSLDLASGAVRQRTRSPVREIDRYAGVPSPDGSRLAIYETRRNEFSGHVHVLGLP